MSNRSRSQPMPAAISFVLTHRLPCAALMLIMLMAAIWLPTLLQGLAPALLLFITAAGLALHLLAPALAALVTFGGGLVFASQMVALAAVGVMLMAGFAPMAGVVVFMLYGLLPIFGAAVLMREDGISKSAEWLALGLGSLTLLGLFAVAAANDLGMREWINQLVAPMFEGVKQQMPAGQETTQMLQQGRQMMVAILPGLMALGLWGTWWANVVLARKIACKYNFYQGDQGSLLSLNFAKPVAYVFMLSLLLMNIGDGGDLQYMASNAAILLAGMLAAQGVAVGHSWLKAKNMMFSIAMMYMMLLIWSVVIIPFVIIGLMDIWFDYRRKLPAVGG